MESKRYKVYLKRGVIIFGIVGALYFLLIHGLTLHKTGIRAHASHSLKISDKKEITAQLTSVEGETEIIKLCNKYTCKKLSFHKKNNLKQGEANCVGYAQYSSALLNYAFSYKGLSSTAIPVVGQVYWYEINIHPFAMSVLPNNLKSFCKDHDFVEIQRENGETIFIDTSLQDLIGKSFFK